ncbi:MAG: B12-binding domain-containing radical SAM protein [Acidobacteria bacterium]|nr:B12-binding domain-containing radical SAM protein [Acidobacteriota bacterium]
MAQVLLTHSYHLAFDPKQVRKMQPYLPLGMLYGATALRDGHITVAAFDSMLKDPVEGFTKALSEHSPKIVVVYEDDFNFLSKMCLTRMREVAWLIAEQARAAGAIAIVHGSDSTDNPELFLAHGFGYVLCGEAEEVLVRLCRALLGGEPVPELAGMVKRDASGKVSRSKDRLAKNPAWSSLSLPARDLIDMEPYRAAWIGAHGYFSTNMVSSRGCPFHCNWCAKPISGNKFHLRSPACVAEEMKQLKSEAGADHIWFGDDVFALDRHWVGQFAEEVSRRDTALPFKIQSRADLMSEGTVKHLKQAGCAEVWMGVESGSQAILNAMDKGLKLSAVRSARRWLKDAGIRACFFLQFGYPGETWRELQETIAFVRETRPDDVGISFSYPLPGTAFYERVQEQLGSKRNWVDSDDLCIMFSGAYTTEFYRTVRDALHAEVDSWSQSTSFASKEYIKGLWESVTAMEPVSREADEHQLVASEVSFSSSAFVPLKQLARATEG